MKLINQNIDITPTPRILRTLGDIPFAPWQCFAELIDNSIDAFSAVEKRGFKIDSPRIDVYWSNDSVYNKDLEIIIEDNALGMELDILQNAAKAGYSSNDPIHNLGLFGMGFNIATAKLGDETLFLSATPDSESWMGIKINFKELILQSSFQAPVVRVAKKQPNESGTRIIIRNLKDGILSEIKRKELSIRRQLESIYTPIIGKRQLQILLQGKQLNARPYCIWSESRFVTRKGVRINAVQEIDRDLGDTFFDVLANRYLNVDESSDIAISLSKGLPLPNHIVPRSRRLKGWLGIQRYSDPQDFGIDFIRNGRKILIKDKSLFSYENPDTGTPIVEYPVELGSTVGGRIVGELFVDYLIPTYQKNGFDTTDRAWKLTVEAIRGAGPILPKQRALLGYDGQNESPLGSLINGYRRADPGTKTLAIANSLAKQFAKYFEAGNLEYNSDEKWYRAAQEADREKGEEGDSWASNPVNSGEIPSDSIEVYLNSSDHRINHVEEDKPSNERLNSTIDELINFSDKESRLTGRYSYNMMPGFDVTVWRIKGGGVINLDGDRIPYIFFQDGIELDFFYDPFHSVFTEYPITIKQVLLFGLTERFSLRDKYVTQQAILLGLLNNHLTDERINYQALLEKASSIITRVKEQLPQILHHKFHDVKAKISEIESDEEDLARRLLEQAPQLLQDYQNNSDRAYQALAYVGDNMLKRIIACYPEDFMDGKVFSLLYEKINLGSAQMSDRLKQNSLEQLLIYFSDLLVLLQITKGAHRSKHELMRYSNTITILENLFVESN